MDRDLPGYTGDMIRSRLVRLLSPFPLESQLPTNGHGSDRGTAHGLSGGQVILRTNYFLGDKEIPKDSHNQSSYSRSKLFSEQGHSNHVHPDAPRQVEENGGRPRELKDRTHQRQEHNIHSDCEQRSRGHAKTTRNIEWHESTC